jgi:PAS domain S-box-containing protein
MKMEASLRESEEQFRGLFEISPVGIFLLDLEGNITAANDRGSAIYGYSREEMLRKNVRDIVPKRLAGNYPRLVGNIRRRKILVFESEGRKKGGRLFPVELTVSLFPWKGKELLQILVQDAGEKRQAEEAERLRKISEALLNFQEEERKRIARDLHDHLGQDLAAIKISLEMSKTALPDGERAMRKEIDETVEMVDKAIGDVRSLSASLRPASLDGLGLVPCLRHELAYLASRGGLKIDLDTRRFAGRLPPEKEIIVYRIVQEAMTNILKHAQARKVRVALSRRGGLVRLAVSDDGRGFNSEKEKNAIGLGLLGMRERVAVAGGDFALASRPGRGTRIVVTLPAAPREGEKV